MSLDYNCVYIKHTYMLFKKFFTLDFKGIVHFEMNFWYVLAYLKGIQDVGLCFCSIFNFDISRSNCSCLSVIWRSMVTTSKSMHREVKIKHDLMTCKCKYTWMA